MLQFTVGAVIEPPFDATLVEIDGTSVRRTARRLGEIAVTDPVFAPDDEHWQWTANAGASVITDVHTHVGEYPLHISEKFAAEARAAWPDVPLGGSLDDHYTDALADVDRAVVLAFNAPAAGFVVPNDYVASYVARDPARLIGFGAVDPSDPSAIDELERMKSDLGLVGCKLGPIYQNVDPLGPDFLRVCEALERLELPMLIHQGTTFARAGSLLLARPILLDEIALRYPKLKIVIAHVGHPWFDEAIAVVRRHPHVYADISGLVTRRWLLYQALVSAIEYRVEHKLLFGTDYPFFSATADDRRPALGHRQRLRAPDAGRRRAGGRGHHPPPHPRAARNRGVNEAPSRAGVSRPYRHREGLVVGFRYVRCGPGGRADVRGRPRTGRRARALRATSRSRATTRLRGKDAADVTALDRLG